MGDVFQKIDEAIEAWIDAQHMFFVATAPLSGDGLINCSPKGLDTLKVLDGRTLAYLDLIGSGAETIAHVRENERVLIMICACDGPPKIMRFHGRGEIVQPGHDEFAKLLALFPGYDSVRSIVRVHLTRIGNSCGYGVPLLEFREDRRALPMWAEKKGPTKLREFQKEYNAASLDGLTAVDWLS